MTINDLRQAATPVWVAIPGGTFLAGSDDFYPEEAPRRSQSMAGFELAATPVTNRQFAAFVAATGHVTVAERPLPAADYPAMTEAERVAGSLVFTGTHGPVALDDWRQWWAWQPGARWSSPYGPGTTLEGRDDHPVVQVAHADAAAYAAWVGGRLPTEAELEYAACAGATPAPYAWGAERFPDGAVLANTWRGSFPHHNEGSLGWVGTSPVGEFGLNTYGLADTIGNVWEWTSTRYSAHRWAEAEVAEQTAVPAQACGCSPTVETSESVTGPTTYVLKGGSHLCAPEYCLRYRPAARSSQSEESATTHIGFRVARSL